MGECSALRSIDETLTPHDIESNLAISPACNSASRESSASDREDHQQNYEERHGSVLAALPTLAGKSINDVAEEIRSMAGRLPGVARLRVSVPPSNRNVADFFLTVGDDDAVGPDPKTTADDRKNDDEISKLEHHFTPLWRKPLHPHGEDGEERQVDPRETASRHYETAPHEKTRPPTNDLALGQVGSACVGVPPTDTESEDQVKKQRERAHLSFSPEGVNDEELGYIIAHIIKICKQKALIL